MATAIDRISRLQVTGEALDRLARTLYEAKAYSYRQTLTKLSQRYGVDRSRTILSQDLKRSLREEAKRDAQLVANGHNEYLARKWAKLREQGFDEDTVARALELWMSDRVRKRAPMVVEATMTVAKMDAQIQFFRENGIEPMFRFVGPRRANTCALCIYLLDNGPWPFEKVVRIGMPHMHCSHDWVAHGVRRTALRPGGARPGTISAGREGIVGLAREAPFGHRFRDPQDAIAAIERMSAPPVEAFTDKPVDADGDGFVYDGTFRERLALPGERLEDQLPRPGIPEGEPTNARGESLPRSANTTAMGLRAMAADFDAAALRGDRSALVDLNRRAKSWHGALSARTERTRSAGGGTASEMKPTETAQQFLGERVSRKLETAGEAMDTEPPRPHVAQRMLTDLASEARELAEKLDTGADRPGAGRRDTEVDTPGDEIVDVGGDVELAADLLSQGKRVQLEQPSQVSTLLDVLRERVREARALGVDAPNIDLCGVSVPGTNLFCAESKGVKRIDMPQLSGVPLPGSMADTDREKNEKGEVDLSDEFMARMSERGVAIADDEVLASHLRASQEEIDGAKVAGMTETVEDGSMGEAYIFVSRDDYIVDGHHRWAAHIGADASDDDLDDYTMPVRRIDLPITELLEEANAFAAEWGIPQADVTSMTTPPTRREKIEEALDQLIPEGELHIDLDEDLFESQEAAGREGEEMPELDWQEPPPPKGVPGQRAAGGYSADRAAGTNTELGRRGERAFVDLLGGEILHPEGKGEQSPLDVHVDGYGVEVKAVSVQSTQYKATPKPHEIAEKLAAAEELGVEPALAIVVLDDETGEAHVYWREGMATGRLSQNTGWKYAGSVATEDSDLQRAAEARPISIEDSASDTSAMDLQERMREESIGGTVHAEELPVAHEVTTILNDALGFDVRSLFDEMQIGGHPMPGDEKTMGAYRGGPSRGGHGMLLVDPDDPGAEASMVHELGHALDYNALRDLYGGYEPGFDGPTGEPPETRGFFGADSHFRRPYAWESATVHAFQNPDETGTLGEVMTVLKDTDWYREASERAQRQLERRGRASQRLLYLLRPQELFARAWASWLAETERALAGAQREVESSDEIWSDADLEAMAGPMESLADELAEYARERRAAGEESFEEARSA